jgi:hypothetical protein
MKTKHTGATLWAAFLHTPSEDEIKETAKRMKDGKAYLFIDAAGNYEIRNKKFLSNNFTGLKFIRKIPV